MVLLLLTFCLLLLPFWESVIVLCFVVGYLMSILVLQSSWWGRVSWLLCLIRLHGVWWWLSGSSSWCHGVVCGLWLWYFLIILSYYFFKLTDIKKLNWFNILKRKSFANLTKMLFATFWPKYFAPWYFNWQVQWFAFHLTWKSDQWDLWLPIFNAKCKATQIRKVTELQYLTFYSSHRVTTPNILFGKRCLTVICFQKQKGR